jgi:hypothetical protein
MNRVIQVLVLAVLALVGLQWYVPRWVSSKVATQIMALDHGTRPQVEVTAIPFWYLLQGTFQDLYVNAQHVAVGPLTVADAQLNWEQGGLSVQALLHHRLSITRRGHMTVSITVDEAALAKFLAQQGKFQNPTVGIDPTGLTIGGKVLLGGVYVPLNTRGTLVVSSDRKSIIFHPTSIDGIQLPMVTDIEIFNVNAIKLPVNLVIQSVTLQKGSMEVKAQTP